MDRIEGRKIMRRKGVNKHGVTFVLVNEITREYLFSCYFGDGLELSKLIQVQSNRNLNDISALKLL